MSASSRDTGSFCRSVLAQALACLTALLLSPALPAQEPGPAPRAPYTLHVYEDLLQMPTLVLDRHHASLPGLTPAQFALRIDHGPVFHPNHTRPEGADALQLALVFDVNQPSAVKLLGSLEQMEPARLAGWLGPRDRLSVYAVDCRLVRSVSDEPYSPALLQADVVSGLAAPALHQRGSGARCGADRRLWDSVGTVIGQLRQLPGWRVVLLVSDGLDTESNNTWNELARYASRFDVTLMGLRPSPGIFDSSAPVVVSRFDQRNTPPGQEDVFAILCSETGGVVLPFRTDTLPRQLTHAVDLLRDRYIVEFPRPRGGVGFHDIETKVPDSRAIVLSSGLSFPPHDPAQDAQPGTIPTDPARLPQVGGRKILQPQP